MKNFFLSSLAAACFLFLGGPIWAQPDSLLVLPSSAEFVSRGGQDSDPKTSQHLLVDPMVSLIGILGQTYDWADQDTLIGQVLVNSEQESYLVNHTGRKALFRLEQGGSLTCVSHQLLGPKEISESEVIVGDFTRRTIAQTSFGSLFLYMRTASIQTISYSTLTTGQTIFSGGAIQYAGQSILARFGMNILRQGAVRVAMMAPPVAIFIAGAGYVWWKTSQDLSGWSDNYGKYQNFWTRVWYLQRLNLFQTYLGAATGLLLAERLRVLSDDELWRETTAALLNDMEKIRQSDWHLPDPNPDKEIAKWLWRIAAGTIALDKAAQWAKENLSPDNYDRVEELVRRARGAEKNKLILICEDSKHDVNFMRNLYQLPFFSSGGYEVVVAESTTDAEKIIRARGHELRLIIIDGNMPPEKSPFSTRRLLPLIPMTTLLVGNTDSYDVQQEMKTTGRFVFVAQHKTEDLKGLPWKMWLPFLP